jgi:putative ABC transport system ATP-binding protein
MNAPVTAGAPVIALRGVTRVYSTGRLEVPALRGVDLDIEPGEFLAIVGRRLGQDDADSITGCRRPTSGLPRWRAPSRRPGDDDLARLRSRTICPEQSHNLPPHERARERRHPLLYQGVGRHERHERAKVALERLGLADRAHHEPSELSGGQQQRVAIARALVTDPAILLADEPTGNLDTASGAEVIELLHELNATGRTIVLITHDADVADHATRQVHVRDGRLVA